VSGSEVKLTKMRLIWRLAGILLFMLGFIVWWSPFVLGLVCQTSKPSTIEFPLGSLGSIAVDGEGRIYCAAGFYSRIQVYDTNGEFLRGWFVDATEGMIVVDVEEDGLLHVRTARGSRHFIYDAEGSLLQEPRDTAAVNQYFMDHLDLAGLRRCSDQAGNSYVIRLSFLYPVVVRETPTGERATVVSMPIYLWPLMGPFPAIAFAFVGLLGFAASTRRYAGKGARPGEAQRQ